MEAQILAYESSKLSKFRNSIAHFNYRLETATTDLKDDPNFPKDPVQAALIENLARITLASLKIHNNKAQDLKVVDVNSSRVRYEENLGGVVSKNSKSMTFQEVRELTQTLEAFVFSLAYAFVEAGCVLQRKKQIRLGVCNRCDEGHLTEVTSVASGECPSCGHSGPFLT